METSTNEKLSIIYELYQVALQDGIVSVDESQFLERIARQIGLEQTEIDSILAGKPIKFSPTKEEHSRVVQLYRLTLMMLVDGELATKEEEHVRMAGIRLGLSAGFVDRLLLEAKKNNYGVISNDVLIDLWRSSNN